MITNHYLSRNVDWICPTCRFNIKANNEHNCDILNGYKLYPTADVNLTADNGYKLYPTADVNLTADVELHKKLDTIIELLKSIDKWI